MTTLQEFISGEFRRPLLLLGACVLCVLIVICANIGGLQLARIASRTKEILVREALGASRVRLVRQFLTENVVLSLFAALLGLMFAWSFIKVVQATEMFTAHSISTGYGAPSFTGVFGKYGDTIQPGLAALIFALILPLVIAVFFGVLPALCAVMARSGRIIGTSAGQVTAGVPVRRFGRTLLVFELAASITLLFCAGLLTRSFRNMMSLGSGFDPHGIITASTQLTDARYQTEGVSIGKQAEAVNRFSDEVLRYLQGVSGVQAAAVANVLPLDNTAKIEYSFDGKRPPAAVLGSFVAFLAVSPDYFQVARTPVIQGRAFQPNDTSTSPRVLVVNRDLSSRFFGGRALGKRLYIRDLNAAGNSFVWATIIGVAEDAPHGGFLRPSEPEIYLPFSQAPQPNFQIAVRAAGTPASLSSEIIRSVTSSDPDVPVSNIETMDNRILHRVDLRRSLTALMSGLGALATLLSAIGTGGMFAYMVAQRAREMGIRLALGASQAQLLRLVIGEVLAILNFGCLVGMVSAFLVARSISSFLIGVGEYDLTVLVESLAFVTAAAVLAGSFPAFHASRSDILAVLREE